MIHKKILQSDWPRAFWAISQEPEFSQVWNLFKDRRITVIQAFIIDHTDKKQRTKKKNWTFVYIQRTLDLAYFPHFGGKVLFWKNLAVIRNTTWTPNTMLSSRKKTKEPIPWKLLNRRTGRPYSYDLPGHGHGSYKKISQLSCIAVDTKDKFSTAQLSTPHEPRNLFKFKLWNYLRLSPACFTLEVLQQF